MAAAIVRKAFDNHDKDSTSTPANYIPTRDKFALKAFNWLSYNQEISGPLVASYLLNLLDHYFRKENVKTINIALLQAKFLLILNGQSFNQSDDIVRVDGSKIRPCSMYKHYAHRGSVFDGKSIYEYLQFVSIVKQSQQQSTDYEFDARHRQRGYFIQRPVKRVKQLALVVLCGNLSKNEKSKNAILGGHPETDACHTDLSLILLSLFVPWSYLLPLFLTKSATLATYKDFCWKIWVKYEPRLPAHVRFYIRNVCQMRKTKIEVRADIAARADARKAAWLAVDNWGDKTTDLADSNGEAKINSANIELVEFGVQTKTSLANSVRQTRCKWAIDNFTKYSNINFITSLIMNIAAESTNHMEESLLICCCQVAKYDCPNIGDIDNISKDVVSSWQEVIRRGGQLPEEDIDMDYDQDDSNISSYHNPSTRILEPIIDEIEMSKEPLTKVEYNRLGKNPQAVTLCDNIQNRLPLNHLQRVVVEEALNHAILNKKNQYCYRSD